MKKQITFLIFISLLIMVVALKRYSATWMLRGYAEHPAEISKPLTN